MARSDRAATLRPMSQIGYVWVGVLVLVSLGFCLFTHSSVFDASVLLSGVLCVGLTALGKRVAYLIGLYGSIAYSVVAWQNGLFGEVGLNLGFYVPTGIIGFLMWSRRSRDGVVRMRTLALRGQALVAGILVAGTLGLGFGLSFIDTQQTPYLDASTNALSVVATILMMWRYREQWTLYFILNAISIVMWVLRWLDGGVAGDAMVVMWSLFLLNSVFGYWRWSVGARQIPVTEGACPEPA